MVTQKDVANLAGVSFITVSRVINGERNVKEETRRKVQSAIDKLGYSPSFAGQVLNSGRCNTIAILTPIPFRQSMRTFYLMEILAGIEEICNRNKIDMMIGIVPEAENNSNFDYLRPYKQKKVDGIIYVGLKKLPNEMISELDKRKLPCVVIGDRPNNKLMSWVDTDNFEAGYNSVQQLWNHGHRQIAFIGINKDIYNENITDREKGFIKALNDLGAKYNPEDYIIRTELPSPTIDAEVQNAFSKWKKKPTAIFCGTDWLVPGTIQGIKKYGLSVPDDISIVGFDGFINLTYFYMNIATFPQPLREMGQRAAEILLNHIKNPEQKKETAVFKVPFQDGDSLRKI